MLALKSLSRFNVIREGQTITDEMRQKDPNATLLYGEYLDEIRKFKEQSGVKDANERQTGRTESSSNNN